MYAGRLHALRTSVECAMQTFGTEIQRQMYAGRLYTLHTSLTSNLQTFGTEFPRQMFAGGRIIHPSHTCTHIRQAYCIINEAVAV